MVPIDMYEKGDKLVITATIPGMKAEDVQITITGNTLQIKGEFKSEREEEEGSMHFQERRYGAFQRSISLPRDVDTDKVEATSENGILRLEIPKTEEAMPKQIAVKAK